MSRERELKATSLRVYLWVESEAEVDGTLDALADALIAQGFNSDDNEVTAAIVVTPDGSDVRAWKKSAMAFGKKALRFGSSIRIPTPNPETQEET